MDRIVTGSNHTVAIGMDQKVYVWGHNNVNNRLGLKSKEDEKNAKHAPVVLAALQDVVRTQSGMQGRGGARNAQDDSMMEEQK